MKTLRALVLFIAAVLQAAGLRADQGMWMPRQIPELAARLKAMGFKGDPKAFADLTGQPMGAVISLGGCSASFVSPDGLIVTNHHCVAGGLQFNSTPERNLLKNGFLAETREKELYYGPGARVLVTTAVTEVTSEITGNIDAKLSDRQRFDLIERRVKERVAQCEKSGLRCNVASFFEGLKYYEIAQMEIRDVRLVYAPAEGIGVFGGETDNWRWPRHTGDWSFLRAYVGPDGKPAAFARLRPVYMEALLAKSGGLVAPDANSTLRVTYGQVRGVDARDGLFYKSQTTLEGIVQKHTGEGEFNAPQKQLDAINALRAGKRTPYFYQPLGDVPVNFLSNVDTTGGNSGSPTLNARGELVGLLFDGTYETVASNFVFNTERTRSIHVDIRYMLWTMSEVDGAVNLLKEMGVVK